MQLFAQLQDMDRLMRVYINDKKVNGLNRVLISGCYFSRHIRETIYSYLNPNHILTKAASLSREDRYISENLMK
jgi:hypothetical protein